MVISHKSFRHRREREGFQDDSRPTTKYSHCGLVLFDLTTYYSRGQSVSAAHILMGKKERIMGETKIKDRVLP